MNTAQNSSITTTACSVCGNSRKKIFNRKILDKHEVDYFYCENCGLLQTEKPYWLEEAYSSAIATTDTGLLVRNRNLSKKLSCVLYFLLSKNSRYIDLGGGYGILVRLMRDIGFDFYWKDPHCQNLISRGFEDAEGSKNYLAATAFEVLEHIEDPIAFVNKSFTQEGITSLIFSTDLFEGDPPIPDDWWYYCFQSGQHISFYQKRTFEYIALKLDLHFYSFRRIHILTKQPINSAVYKLLTTFAYFPLFQYVRMKMKSKTFSDFEYISRSTQSKNSTLVSPTAMQHT